MNKRRFNNRSSRAQGSRPHGPRMSPFFDVPDPFAAMQRGLEQMASWTRGRPPMRAPMRAMWPFPPADPGPAADIVEREDAFILSIDTPGMDEKDIDIQLSDDTLTIRGKRSQEREDEDEDNYHLWERRRGSFTRSFTLPPSIDTEAISASYDKGVLTVVMPKSKSAKKKQRSVKIEKA